MPSFADLIQQSSAHAWLFIPSAILLGALHGLEPGHSKTMMAAFIVAIRGTVGQAVLLGLAATLSHTFVVWVIAIGGMYLWQGMNAATFEPYFQLASAAIIIGIALWMLWRIWGDQQRAKAAAGNHQHGTHDHEHHHDAELRRIDTGHGGHTHDGDLSHVEGHDHRHEQMRGLEVATDGYQDAHELAHVDDIRRSFADRKVTAWQIAVFGLTGGLIPCPGAITVLVLCLQLKEITLGFALVLCFSIGLAITLVAVGAAAALSVGHAMKRWAWFGAFARRAPYFSGVLILAIGLSVGYQGWAGLAAPTAASAPAGG